MTANNYVDAIAERNAAIATNLVLEAKLKRARDSLAYITQPTMGFPGDGPWYGGLRSERAPWPEPEQWVRAGHGTPDNIRLALATCIAIATQAMKETA